jgi:O-antigen ligase
MSPAVKPQYFTWLIFSSLLLFPVARSVELPVLIMTIGGGVLLYKQGWAFYRQPAVKFFTLLFACVWLPMLISLPDSYDLKASGGAVAGFIRLYLSGLFIIWALRDPKQASLLVKLLAWLTAFWVVDALFQAATGHDLFGFAQIPARLNGVFGEHHLKLGNALPVLAPFLILALRRNTLLMVLATILTGAVVILAGSRGGWASFGLVCIWLIISEAQRRELALWKMGVVAVLVGLIGTIAAFENPGAKKRLDQTLLLFSGDEVKIDQALSYRWTIWKDAFAMVKDHPINGVGVSTFRFAYPEYAQPNDFFMRLKNVDEASGRPTGVMYAHQMVLEVTTETGLIGLAGLILFYSLLIKHWRLAKPEQRIQALPFAMAALAWIFPFNTHPSFYSAHWSIMIWLMIAMLCASLLPRQKTVDTAT